MDSSIVDKLIEDIVFSPNTTYSIRVMDYIKDAYESDKFINRLCDIMVESEVKLIKSTITYDENGLYWNFTVTK